MKICYIANSASYHTEKWVKHFLSLGNEVYVISHENVPIEGAKVYYVDYNLKNFILKRNEVHRIIKEIKPDVLHAHQANTCGLYAATMKGFKPIISAWGSDILVAPNESFLLKKMVQYVIKHALFITSDSYYMSEKIVELGGNKDIIYTFPMGIENDILEYKHVFTDEPALNIISDRRLEKMYKIDLIIEGFSMALKKYPNMHLTIAADGSEKQNLEKLTQELNIADKVTFTGRYEASAIGSMLRENDVFISIPESDSTSVSLLEGMYVGLFPIVSDLPANREWVKDKENGLVINKFRKEEVCEAIEWCFTNKKHMKDVSSKNTDIIKSRALWENNAKIVEELYKKSIDLK